MLILSNRVNAQNDSIKVEVIKVDSTNIKPYVLDPLSPSKAAFYSAVIPGLGQVYNKKYWKVPLVFGGMGLSIYYYAFNNKEYHRYRDAYKDRLAGRQVEGVLAGIDNDRLLRGQRFYQRNRDLSALCIAGVYVLNIIDANVDAHLKQFNVNENLSFSPGIVPSDINYNYAPVLGMSYRF
ncbi:hypothetical protein AM493_19000 [Flavobacterium akiainvivens]|uniref:DUF5683 domain-containing protein n=1 Tax=Flavobacterium akiainvivens TaxID=1202724 RepID=A0A0M8ML38_9FLAO|nr:DUF5683 domain-containing protein [Flavobacterium akiainvivens]KOS08421.1 hypothetical protein AM493_19000 [Flavobacterium akiainvivens]